MQAASATARLGTDTLNYLQPPCIALFTPRRICGRENCVHFKIKFLFLNVKEFNFKLHQSCLSRVSLPLTL